MRLKYRLNTWWWIWEVTRQKHEFGLLGAVNCRQANAGWAKGASQLWVHTTQFVFVLLFISYCVIFHTNNYNPPFPHPVCGETSDRRVTLIRLFLQTHHGASWVACLLLVRAKGGRTPLQRKVYVLLLLRQERDEELFPQLLLLDCFLLKIVFMQKWHILG